MATTYAIDGYASDDPARRKAQPGEPFVCWICSSLIVPAVIDEAAPGPGILPVSTCARCWKKATGA